MPTAARPSPDSSATTGAAFLMATSAIGPGFLTQTAVFTSVLGADFAFAILASVLVDLAVQVNVWRVLGSTSVVFNFLSRNWKNADP